MIEQPHAVRIGRLEVFQGLSAGHRRQHLRVALHHALLADDFDAREVAIPANVVGVRLSIDQMADRPVFEQSLAPSDGVDRLLGRIDHEHAVPGRNVTRVAAPEINLRVHVLADVSHAQAKRHRV
jgi:hypothetical protein